MDLDKGLSQIILWETLNPKLNIWLKHFWKKFEQFSVGELQPRAHAWYNFSSRFKVFGHLLWTANFISINRFSTACKLTAFTSSYLGHQAQSLPCVPSKNRKVYHTKTGHFFFSLWIRPSPRSEVAVSGAVCGIGSGSSDLLLSD